MVVDSGSDASIVSPNEAAGNYLWLGPSRTVQLWAVDLAAETTATIPLDVATIVSYHVDDNALSLGINGVEETDTYNGPMFSAHGGAIGAWPTAGYGATLDGEFFVILAAKPGLSAADRDRVEGWLAHTFGITGNLQVGHAYKTVAPLTPPPATWGRIYTPSVAKDDTKTLDSIDLVVTITEGGSATTTWMDAAQIEQDTGQGATAYADGDQGDGHYWSGTPGLSMAVRDPLPAEVLA
jgi:hypothetical protein